MNVRPCRLEELAHLDRSATAVFRPDRSSHGQHAGDMARAYPLLFDPSSIGRLWLAEEDGDILAHAGYSLFEAVALGRQQRVACFGAVFTAEHRQGQGLATRVLEQAIAAARAEGAQIGLVSGSRGLYHRLGFAAGPPVELVIAAGELAAAADPSTAAELSVSPARESDAPALSALYQGEPVHFLRGESDWLRLLQAGTVYHGPGSIWVVRRQQTPVAYAAIEGQPWAAGPMYRALEIAGDRQALAGSIPQLTTHLAATHLGLLALPHDHALAAEAAQRHWPSMTARLPLSTALWDASLAGLPIPWYGLNYV